MAMPPVEPSMTEAEEIVREVLRSTSTPFDTYNATMQVNALQACLGIVRAMQTLGWRVARPLHTIRAEDGKEQSRER